MRWSLIVSGAAPAIPGLAGGMRRRRRAVHDGA
jgi:hypothetical protein